MGDKRVEEAMQVLAEADAVITAVCAAPQNPVSSLISSAGSALGFKFLRMGLDVYRSEDGAIGIFIDTKHSVKNQIIH